MSGRPALGFIGIGAMGEPMALNLLKAGYALTVYARRADAAAALVKAGAQLAATPAALAHALVGRAVEPPPQPPAARSE